MTSEEISNLKEDHFSEKGWLKEIAYHLARLNERALPPWVTLSEAEFSERYVRPALDAQAAVAACKAEAGASEAMITKTEFERKLAAANESLKPSPKKRK